MREKSRGKTNDEPDGHHQWAYGCREKIRPMKPRRIILGDWAPSGHETANAQVRVLRSCSLAFFRRGDHFRRQQLTALVLPTKREEDQSDIEKNKLQACTGQATNDIASAIQSSSSSQIDQTLRRRVADCLAQSGTDSK